MNLTDADAIATRKRLEHEECVRRAQDQAVNRRIDKLTESLNTNAEALEAAGRAADLVMTLLLLHLAWHTVAKAVEWWRWER